MSLEVSMSQESLRASADKTRQSLNMGLPFVIQEMGLVKFVDALENFKLKARIQAFHPHVEDIMLGYILSYGVAAVYDEIVNISEKAHKEDKKAQERPKEDDDKNTHNHENN